MTDTILATLVIWNVIVFLIYGIDKWCAKNNIWRISEKTLIGMAFLMGAVGALFGMELFRHKTKKKMFLILITIAFWVNIAVVFLFERV